MLVEEVSNGVTQSEEDAILHTANLHVRQYLSITQLDACTGRADSHFWLAMIVAGGATPLRAQF